MAIHSCIHFWHHVGDSSDPGFESAEDMNRVTHVCHACLFGSQLKESRTMRTRTRIISYACFSYISDVSTRNISIRVGL